MSNTSQHIIIVGTGLGALSAGVILSKNGYRVTLLEQASQIGGCLQCFTRRGVKFETGMHFIGSAASGQSVDLLLRYLEVRDKLELSPLDAAGFDVVRLSGQAFPLANGRERFVSTLSRQFPADRECLERYCQLIEDIARGSAIHSLRYDASDDALLTKYQLSSVGEVLADTISNPTLAKVLAGTQILYAGEEKKTPFATHAFIRDTYAKSAYRIVGGSDFLAQALKDTIERYGGEVRTHSRVTHILTDGKKVVGVEINGEERLYAPIVISAIHPLRTIELTDAEAFRRSYKERISSIPQTVGCFSVYLHFKENTLPYMNHNEYVYPSGKVWGTEQYTAETWPESFMYMHFCHKADARFAETGVVLSYMRMDELQQWANTTLSNRPEAYQRFKEEHKNCLLERLEETYPGIRAAIAHSYASTPLTHAFYTETVGGSMYGMAKDVHNLLARRVPVRTRIEGLLQTGQNVLMHGLFGVLIGSLVTCCELLPAERLFSDIHKT